MRYITNCEIADEDWKTQCALGYPNIPANTEVEMVKKEYRNFYGCWCIVRWNGQAYYTLRNNIKEE